MSTADPVAGKTNSGSVYKPEENVVILVVSWDGYRDLWRPFFHCFFKYWPDCPYRVFLGSNHLSYTDSRVSPVFVGPDVDYSSNLLKMLRQLDTEWVILWVDDCLLSAQVNTTRVRNLIEVAQSEKAGHLRLNVAPLYVAPLFAINNKDREISEMPTEAPYRVSIGLSLWRKSTLVRVLRPGETAWDIERRGTQRSYDLEEKFYCLSKQSSDSPPFPFVHGVYRGKWLRRAAWFLRQEGLQDCLKTRGTQTCWSNICHTAYCHIYYLSFAFLYIVGGERFMRIAGKVIASRKLSV